MWCVCVCKTVRKLSERRGIVASISSHFVFGLEPQEADQMASTQAQPSFGGNSQSHLFFMLQIILWHMLIHEMAFNVVDNDLLMF